MEGSSPPEATSALAELIEQHYVFADRAGALASEVRCWDAELPPDPTDEVLAAALTDRLRAVTGDVHFKVTERRFTPAEQAAAPEDRWRHVMPGSAANFGFQSVEVTDGTGVVTVTSLDHVAWSGPTARAAMEFVRHCGRVVIDVRQCQGGDPELIEMLAGYFLGDSPVELSTVHWRDGAIEHCRSNPAGASFRFEDSVVLVVVVGPNTASGGEALADHLQAPGRAVVVGQPSVGAAHRVKEFQLTENLVARIPSGLVVNAFTGTDWEGQGVVPDVEVPVDDDPLEVARSLQG